MLLTASQAAAEIEPCSSIASSRFTEAALIAIAQRAIERRTGVRGLRSVMESLLRKVMFDMPTTPDARICQVDESNVTGDEELSVAGE